MFKRLISNLPFNPSLIGQVVFYWKYLRKEKKSRQLSLIMIALAVILQLSAVLSPPEPTIAESDNDILRGGFSSPAQAVNYCRSNTQSFATILNYYEVSCDMLQDNATTRQIRSTDYSRQLDSMGRLSQGSVVARTDKPTDEYGVFIDDTTYYMRNLWAWDSGIYSSYHVLDLKNTDGDTIMIMFNSGNIITVGRYSPPPSLAVQDYCLDRSSDQTSEPRCDTCPNVPGAQSGSGECYGCSDTETVNNATACLEFEKTASNLTRNIENANGTTAHAGDTIVYSLVVKNKGNQAVQNFTVKENISDVLQYSDITDLGGGTINEENVVRWPKAIIGANSAITKEITVKVKDPVSPTPVSVSDPSSFDLIMTSTFYSNSVNIKLPAPAIKTVELVVTSLPNTSPRASMAIALIIVAEALYLFARTRLLAKETEIVKRSYSISGGY